MQPENKSEAKNKCKDCKCFIDKESRTGFIQYCSNPHSEKHFCFVKPRDSCKRFEMASIPDTKSNCKIGGHKMNNSEIIDALNEIRGYQDRGITDYYNGECRCETVDDIYGDVISNAIEIISATIPRETAKCKPEQEDAEQNGLVLAWYADFGCYDAFNWETVYEQPESFPFWLPMPTAPKAEGKENV